MVRLTRGEWLRSDPEVERFLRSVAEAAELGGRDGGVMTLAW